MSPSALARLAGVLVLLLVFIGPVAMVIVPGEIVVPGDPVGTHEALSASPGLFRVGLTAEAAVVAIEVVLTAVLWVLLRPVSAWLAATAALARAVMTALQGVGLLFGIALALGAPTATPALVDAATTLRTATILAWQVPFGLHLLALGALVYRAGFLPRWLGPLVAFAGLAYIQHTAVMVLWPEAAGAAQATVAIAALVGELPLFLWMLVRGVRGNADARPSEIPALAS